MRELVIFFIISLILSGCGTRGKISPGNESMAEKGETTGKMALLNAKTDSVLLRNARITLEVSCQARPGESVLILTDRDSVRMACSRALEVAAVDMGLIPVIMDVTAYGKIGLDKARRDPLVGVMTSVIAEPVKRAVEAADIVIRSPGMDLHYTTILGDPDANDKALTAEKRRMQLQTTNMDKWNISPEDVAIIRRRTLWLNEKLHTVKKIRVTSPAGTDMTFGMGPGCTWYPILGIIPLYGEVAVIPQVGQATEGVFITDGSTQSGIRPPQEKDRIPLRIVVKNGRVQDVSGDPEQVARMKKLVAETNSPEVTIDELGIVTTSIAENDDYWTNGRYTNGTHSHNSVHIAPGNNVKRGEVVHSTLHFDCDILHPTLYLDELVIMKDGVFIDSVTEK